MPSSPSPARSTQTETPWIAVPVYNGEASLERTASPTQSIADKDSRVCFKKRRPPSSQRKRLYLHAGTIKTGSTALQYFLRDNKEALAKFGYRPAIESLSHQKIKACLTNTKEEWERFGLASRQEADVYLSSVTAEINSLRTENLFLTHENFFQTSDINIPHTKWFTSIDPQRMKDFFGGLDRETKLVLYLRRQDSLIASAYTTYAGYFRNHLPFDAWEKPRFDFAETLDVMAGVFGKENLIVRVFEKEQLVGGSVIPDFLSLWGLTPEDGFAFSDRRENLAPPAEVLEILREIAPTLNDRKAFVALSNKLQLWAARLNIPRRPLLTRAQAKALYAPYKASNERVARDYLGRNDGILFQQTPDSPNEPFLSEDIKPDPDLIRRLKERAGLL